MKFLGLAAGQAWLVIAGSAVAVVLLYLLKPSPRRLLIASNVIWRRMLRERKQQPERLRWWLSLLLALAIALAVALALTQPEIAAVGGSAEDHVVVIDNSPSMAARGSEGRTRLERALERGADIVRSAGAGSRFLVADTVHQLPATGFESRAVALALLNTIEARAGTPPWFPDAGRNLAQTVKTVESGMDDGPAGNPRRAWLVTDGVARLQTPAGTQVVSVFRSAPNVGITAFDVRAVPVDARRYDAFIEVSNGGPEMVQVEVTLTGLGGPPISRILRVPGREATRLVLDASSFSEGPLQARVRMEADALDLDNTAYAYLPAKSRVRLALVTPGNAELMRVLRLLPRLDVVVVNPARMRDLAGFDAAILDRMAPARVPPLPTMLIAPGRVSWLPARTAEVTDTRIDQWDTTHPLLAGIALRDVLIDHAVPLRAVDGFGTKALTALAQGPGNEALILATREGARLAVLSFALEASNFALQSSFPGFLANTVDWLTREPQVSAQRLGLVSLPWSDARVLNLDGNAVVTRQAPGATVFDADSPGLYTAVAGDQRLRVAVNVLDPRLTAINVTSTPDQSPTTAWTAPTDWKIDPWLALLLTAIALLAIEWWTYHRRLTE